MIKTLIIFDSEPKPVFKIEVLNAEMPFPGWVKFEIAADLPDFGEEPTVVGHSVPEGGAVELQSEIDDRDIVAAVPEPGYFHKDAVPGPPSTVTNSHKDEPRFVILRYAGRDYLSL